jgi:uncharacterized SAM-binding protein YcdF (DUF218 family)
MPDMLWVKAAFKAVVLPPTGPLLVAIFGLGLARRFPRTGRAMAIAGVVSLLLLSLPIVAIFLLGRLETYPPLDLTQAKSAQAIVILGGGTRRHAPEYGGETLGPLTLERVRYGARVARLTALPVLVTGGVTFGEKTEASLMRQALEEEFGVPVRWIEPESRNTHENAVRSAEILRAEGIRQVLLVAHEFDMERTRAEFADQDIATIAAPTGIVPQGGMTLIDYVPSITALNHSYYALYELWALLARRMGLAG